MLKYFSANNTRKYVDILDLLVDQYNNTIHSSIKMSPKEASRKESEIKCGEIYSQNLVLRPWPQSFCLAIMFEYRRNKMCLIKDTLKGGGKWFSKFQKYN